jgi:hypothetical protein
MKEFILAVLFAFVVAALVFAHSSDVPSAGLSDAGTVRQMSRDWADATRAIDVNRLKTIHFVPEGSARRPFSNAV